MKSYKIGQSTYDEALQGIVSIGYTTDKADFYLSMAEYELEQEQQENEIEGIEFSYVEGLIDKNQAIDQLGRLNVPSQQVLTLITNWDISRLKKQRIPTRAELDSFYRDDIISDTEYREGLEAKRYKPDTVNWYVVRIDRLKAKDAQEDLERVQKEQDRLNTSERKSQYYEERAELDVLNAEIALAIANLKLSLHEVENDTAKQNVSLRIDQLKAEKENNDLAIAELKLDLEREI